MHSTSIFFDKRQNQLLLNNNYSENINIWEKKKETLVKRRQATSSRKSWCVIGIAGSVPTWWDYSR